MSRKDQRRYQIFLKRLRATREASGMSQEQVASALHQFQSFVSKSEIGTRRMDVIELMNYLEVIGENPSTFVAALMVDLLAVKRRAGRKA